MHERLQELILDAKMDIKRQPHPEKIGKSAFISSTSWVSIAPESDTNNKTLSNRKIIYNPAYQDKNNPITRLTEPVIKAFFGGSTRQKVLKHFQDTIDYFKIDQIFIPIIEEEHWSLAIVNHPRKAFEKLLQGITRQQVNISLYRIEPFSSGILS